MTAMVFGATLTTGCGSGSPDVAAKDTLTNLEQSLKINSVYRIKRDHTYVDLNTGKRLELEIDTISHRVIDKITRYPVLHFIDLTANDTLDQSGRVINRAIRKGADGSWYIDEDKLDNKKNGSDSL